MDGMGIPMMRKEGIKKVNKFQHEILEKFKHLKN